MAKNHILPRYLLWVAVCVCVLLSSSFLAGQLPSAVRHLPEVGDRAAISKQLEAIYRAELGVKEATGNNDGSRVGEYLRYCGLNEGYAWCAAFVSWCHGQAGYPEPRNAWAAALLPTARRVNDPRPGDVFGIYYSNLKRIAHVGFVDRWDDRYCITVEGNTGPPADGTMTKSDPANPIRAGPPVDGVYRKRRPIKTIKAVARWTK